MRGKWIIGIIVTLVSIAFGIILPLVVFSAEDKKIILSKEVYSVSKTQFDYNSTLLDVMSGVPHIRYDIDVNETDIQLSEEDVKRIAYEFISMFDMTPWDIKTSDIKASSDISITPRMCIMFKDNNSEVVDASVVESDYYDDFKASQIPDINLAAVLWRVDITYGTRMGIDLVIDDTNKKVVAFNMYPLYENEITCSLSNEQVFNNIFSFLKNYYDLEVSMYINGEVATYRLKDEDGKTADIYTNISWGIFINNN